MKENSTANNLIIKYFNFFEIVEIIYPNTK